MVAVSGISSGNYGYSLNSFLAATSARESVSAAPLRQVDEDIRTQARRAAAARGIDATVVTNIQYTVGPDGQLYATGGTVSTSRRIKGPESFAPSGVSQQQNNYLDEAANDNSQSRQPQSLADLLPPQLGLSSSAFATLFSESSNEAQILNELQAADAGTRAHEHQHFKAAGGLASGLPEFQYEVGPDGQLYAVGGYVNVSTTPTSDPEKAARDAAGLSMAASAPGDASAQDMKAAKKAYGNAASLYNQANGLGNQQIFDIAV